MLAAERVGVTRTSAEGLCSWRGRATPRSGGDPRGGHRSADPSPRPAPLRSSGSYAKRGLARPPFPSKRPAPRACIHRPRLRGANVNRAMFTNTQDAMFTNAQELGTRRRIRAGRRPAPGGGAPQSPTANLPPASGPYRAIEVTMGLHGDAPRALQRPCAEEVLRPVQPAGFEPATTALKGRFLPV